MNNSNQPLKWRFDISTFKLIGRDLITDRVTAIFELIKNCYDANSKRVDLIFENIDKSEQATIKIIDDGFGMSFSDIRDKWMVIGTSNKRIQKLSPPPFNRRNVGEKGIGRFAVDKLGDNLSIITKTEKDDNWLKITINWNDYYQKFINSPENNIQISDQEEKYDTESDKQIKLFTDVKTKYDYLKIDNTDKKSGTSLIISNLRDSWTLSDIKRLENEIKKIVSPFNKLVPPFNVYITCPVFEYDNFEVRAQKVDFATFEANITYDKNYQESLYFDPTDKIIKKKKIELQSFGGVKISLYFFDESARRKYNKLYEKENSIDGLKIYRDGIITTPFAESASEQDKKRDILGIDKRLWQNIFDRISTREFTGVLEITSEENPNIIDSTNRQDFLDNKEYRDLKEFIIIQLTAFEEYKKHLREVKKTLNEPTLDKAKGDLDELTKVVQNVVSANPSLKPQLESIIEVANKTSKSVKSVIKLQKETEQEFLRKENMYLSVMSLQEYAVHITHAVRTSLGKIQRKAQFFHDYYPDSNEEEYFVLYSKEIYEEMLILNKVIDFMLSYSQSNLMFKEVNIYELIYKIFKTFDDLLTKNNIKYQIDAPNNLILVTQEHFIIDIFQNLISNSIKALKDETDKTIKCSISVNKQSLEILLSDNGIGISQSKWDWVFGIYNTTTELEGGAGIGLYIVKTRVESLKGTIKIIPSEFINKGTTFQINFPLK